MNWPSAYGIPAGLPLTWAQWDKLFAKAVAEGKYTTTSTENWSPVSDVCRRTPSTQSAGDGDRALVPLASNDPRPGCGLAGDRLVGAAGQNLPAVMSARLTRVTA